MRLHWNFFAQSAMWLRKLLTHIVTIIMKATHVAIYIQIFWPLIFFVTPWVITLEGWGNFYWVVKPRHISTKQHLTSPVFHHIWSQLMTLSLVMIQIKLWVRGPCPALYVWSFGNLYCEKFIKALNSNFNASI